MTTATATRTTRPTLTQQVAELRAELAARTDDLIAARAALVGMGAAASALPEVIAAFVKEYRSSDLDGHPDIEYVNGYDDCANETASAIVSQFAPKAVEPGA